MVASGRVNYTIWIITIERSVSGQWCMVHGRVQLPMPVWCSPPSKEVEQLIESRMVEHKKEMERKKAESTRKVKKRKRQMESQGNSSKGCLSIIIIIMHHCLKN